MRLHTIMMALAIFGATQAQAADEEHELAQTVGRIVMAGIFEAANYASEKCPGLHIVEDGVNATADEEGITDDVINSDEWKLFELRGQADARIGYEKNPTEWCERMWRVLGPDHPAAIKHALLTKD